MGMKSGSITVWLLRIARKQLVYLLLASAVVAVFWAITGQHPSLAATLIYSFVLGNLTTLTLELAGIPCFHRWSGLVSLGLFLVIIPVAVIVATAIVFVFVPPVSLPPAPRTSFWVFLLTAWKFPVVASLIFGGGYFAYAVTRTRLEDRNSRLQQVINTDIAERRLDAAELQQAREIQQGLLPKEIPQVAEFEITGAWEPAKLVGGDYYDVIRLSKSKLAICVADVVGKGISAALLMANVQASVRAFASESSPPSLVCSNINSVLCTNLASGKFVTLFYGVLDAGSRTLHYTSAGHLRPIVIDSNGSVAHLENGGALLGVFPDWKYEDSTVELNPGDLLLLFTDGITEAIAPDGEEFGEDRLIAAATRSPGLSINDLQSQLLGRVKSFCNSQMSDDATLILIATPGTKAGAKNTALSRDQASAQLREYAGVQL
jgi:sigma-B regulation protein RsbU (phosphoserine phosphatase)